MKELIPIGNLLDDYESWLIDIQSAVDIEEIRTQLKKINTLKKLLKTADTFRSQSVKYAKLEAYALIQIVKLNGECELSGKRKQAAIWLSTLNENDLGYYISKCEDGKTIENVWWHYFGKEETYQLKLKEVSEKEEELIDTLNSEGKVDLIEYQKYVRERFRNRIATDLIDGTRRKLRDRGGLGINDHNGTYIKLQNHDKNELARQAVLERIRSITADISKLNQIACYNHYIIKFLPEELFGVNSVYQRTPQEALAEQDRDSISIGVLTILLAEFKLIAKDDAFNYLKELYRRHYQSSTARGIAKSFFDSYIKYSDLNKDFQELLRETESGNIEAGKKLFKELFF